MEQAVTATPAAVQWCSLGSSRSAKRSLFFAGSNRRLNPVVYQQLASPEPSADSPKLQEHDSGRPGSQFNRSFSMHVRSSRNSRKSCSNSSESSSQPTYTDPRTKAGGWQSVSPVGQSPAPEFEYYAFPRTATTAHRSTDQDGNTVSAKHIRLSDKVLYGTPTKRPRDRSSKSAPERSDSDRHLPPKPPRASGRPSAAEVEFSGTSARVSVDNERCARLETALQERDDELRELRQTIETNEKALLRSLEDERRRWTADRQRLQAELLSARSHGLPVLRPTFRSPSEAPSNDRVQTPAVVVVEPSQRHLPAVSRSSSDTPALICSTTNTANARPDKPDSRFSSTGYCDSMTSLEISLPVEVASGNMFSDTGKNDFEVGRQLSRAEIDVVGDDVAQKLRFELELCRQQLADERRRWVSEKQVVVEYQLRLQEYCRQLAERNRLLEERMKTMSLELGRNGGSSGYSSDSAALVAQFLDDSSLLTSSL